MSAFTDKNGVYHISAHRLNTMKTCPFKALAYLRHWECDDPDTTYINAGNAVHHYMEDRINGVAPKSVDELVGLYDVSENMRQRVETCIANSERIKGRIDEAEAEVTKHTIFVTPKGRTVDLETRIDALTPTEVIDWKTGAKVSGNPEYVRQMHCYIFATEFTRNATLISLLSNEEYTLEANKAPKDYVPNLCDEYIDNLEDLNFPRITSYFCKSCEYRKYCLDGADLMPIKDVPVYKERK